MQGSQWIPDAVIVAGTGGLGWLIKRWVGGLRDDVHEVKDSVKDLDDKLDNTQLDVAEIRGHLGMPRNGKAARSRTKHPWGTPS